MHLATDSTAQPPADLSTAYLHQVASILVSQVIALLRETVTTDEQLTFTSELIPGSTIGKHLRHIHDHFRLLLDALSTASTIPSATPLPLNYDTRTRNLSSETLHAVALDSFVSLSSRLDAECGPRAKLDGGRRIMLSATTPLQVEVGTTVARELWFACLHATHHFALLRVVAVGELSLSIDPGFGVAPSTLVFRSDAGAPETKL